MTELQSRGISQRRACHLASVSRSTASYQAKPDRDSELRQQIARLADEHRYAGYRVIYQQLRRDDQLVNHKRVQRIWREEGHCQPIRRKRKRAKGKRRMPFTSSYRGHVWSLDFMHESTPSGAKLKLLTVVDDFTRECLAIEVGYRMNAGDVLNVLKALMRKRGAPAWVRTDNGAEFLADALQRWLASREVKSHFIKPGSPWQNGINERFNGTLRKECLNDQYLYTLLDARTKLSMYERYYNERRLHSSLGYRTPSEYAAACVDSSTPSPPRSQARQGCEARVSKKSGVNDVYETSGTLYE